MYVLVVDDDFNILSTIVDQLEQQGWIVDTATSGRQALSRLSETPFDVVILDVMMPEGDGLFACRELRKAGCTSPVLMLTARDTLDDKVNGFEAGADDYLVKPFHMAELIYRVKALAKRISKQNVSEISLGDLTMDLDKKTVCRSGDEIVLGKIQFKLLRFMLLQHPKVVTREQLEREVWGDEPPNTDALRSHLYQLRQIIDQPYETKILKTIRGIGYCLKSPVSDEDVVHYN